jgi:hypothetical protein
MSGRHLGRVDAEVARHYVPGVASAVPVLQLRDPELRCVY